jgi:hypothetical protein
MSADPRGDARAIIEVEMQSGAVGEIGDRLRHRISAVAQGRIGGRALRACRCRRRRVQPILPEPVLRCFQAHFRANGRRWHVFAFDLKPGVGPWDEIAKRRSFRKRNPHIETTVSRALISAPGCTCDGKPAARQLRLAQAPDKRAQIGVAKFRNVFRCDFEHFIRVRGRGCWHLALANRRSLLARALDVLAHMLARGSSIVRGSH